MCGIVAIVSPGGEVSDRALNQALDSLHHRGPDGRGAWRSPRRDAALGHARLSIIDLETGAQPISSLCPGYNMHITVNGEFYGFEAQRRELQRLGHRFSTRSDSEVALHLFEDHGVGAFRQLRGEFALALWDEGNRRLYAARDRLGVKPLYYAIHRGALYLASEVKALFAAGVPPRWDLRGVYLGAGLRGASRTLFEGVSALPPGCYLEFDERGLRVNRYWDALDEAGEAATLELAEQELVERMRAELDESVRLRLRADVPVACYLSGGLDSCAVLGLASRQASGPLRSFTVRFSDSNYDEGEAAAKMAAHAGSDHHELLLSQDDLASHFADSVYHAETHVTNAHGVAKHLLSRAVRDAGYKVVLTGEGADEALLGYPHFRQDWLQYDVPSRPGLSRDEQLQRLASENRASHGRLLAPEKAVGSAAMEAALGFVPAWLQVQLESRQRGAKPLDYDQLERACAGDPVADLLDELGPLARISDCKVAEKSALLWARTMLPNYILAVLGDRSEMAHSVEGRLPFLDASLWRFLAGVPAQWKIRDGVEKYLLREAVRDLVPAEVYQARKHPFLSPPVDLASNVAFAELAGDLLVGAASAVPFLDPSAVANMLAALHSGNAGEPIHSERNLLYVMSLVVLQQRFGLQA